MRNWIERYGSDVIIIFSVISIIALLAWGAVFVIRPTPKQIDRAIKQADEQTARIWPEDRYEKYGNVECFN